MNKTFHRALLSVLLSGCASFHRQPQLLYGLRDDQLDLLGQHLGYHVEALGMSVYRFTRGKHRFSVIAHNDIAVSRRVQADAPVVLSYDSPGRRPPLESRFSIEHGLTFEAVETRFRRFLAEAHLPAAAPRQNNP